MMDRITPELRKKYKEAKKRPGAKKRPNPKIGYSEQGQKVIRTKKKKGGSIGTHNRLY